jgi:hypothetical protein
VDIHIPTLHRAHTAVVIPRVEGSLLEVAHSLVAYVVKSDDRTAIVY